MARIASFRCADRAVDARYLGARRWQVARAGGDGWSGESDGIGDAIARLLGLDGEVAYDSKMIEVRVDGELAGTIKNNTFPTSAWWFNLADASGAHDGVGAAVLGCLEQLRLRPERALVTDAAPLDARFARVALDDAADAGQWAAALAAALTARMVARSDDPEGEAARLVAELNALGHDLYSFDESDDFTIWGYDYVHPPLGRRLVLTFSHPPYDDPSVSIEVSAPPASD